jgi:hypothetical protein
MTRLNLPSLIAPVVVVAGLTLVSCGGNDDGTQANLPTLPGGTAVAQVDDDTSTTVFDPRTSALAFAECMRSNGVEAYPDPVFSDTGEATFTLTDEDDPDIPAATEACQALLDNTPGFTPTDQSQVAANQQRMLDFAQCMRDAGFDMPDPVFGDTPDAGNGDQDEPQVQPETQEFLDARQTCSQQVGAGEEPMP